MASVLTILEGSTFCICDDRGDIAADTSGFFAADTRFLSRLVLRLDGSRPLLLSSGRVQHFSASFFLRNANTGALPHDVPASLQRVSYGNTSASVRWLAVNLYLSK